MILENKIAKYTSLENLYEYGITEFEGTRNSKDEGHVIKRLLICALLKEIDRESRVRSRGGVVEFVV